MGSLFFFLHYLSSNWLLHGGFLSCPTINVLLFMRLINGQCSFVKNTQWIARETESLRAMAKRHSSAKMKFSKTDLVFTTKLDYFSSCCHSASVAISQLKFCSWPKILFESTWLSTIFAVLLWFCLFQKLQPSCLLFGLLFVTHCWGFMCVGHHIQCAAPAIFAEELLFCIQIEHVHTHTRAQRCTNAHWHTRLSLSL